MHQQMQVDFIIIGAQKSGTTSLANQIAQHPKICFCGKKEPNFFSTTEHTKEKLAHYHSLFNAAPGQMLGEASTTYTFLPHYPQTTQRMNTYNPDMKLIYIMRQPVDRIVSNYAHKLMRGRIKLPPEVEVFSNSDYITRSRYAVQVEPYFELFPHQNILLLVFEEYIAAPKATLRSIANFLELSPDQFDDIDMKILNRSIGTDYPKPLTVILTPFLNSLPWRVRQALGGKFYYRLDSMPTFSNDLRRLIWRFVESDVRQLEARMGRSLDIWRETKPEFAEPIS